VNDDTTKEFRFKGGSSILSYIRQFSSTEKAIFAVLAVIVAIAALIMANGLNNYFMVEIPGNGGELREGMVGLPRTINPVLAVTDVDRDISALVYSGLTKYSDGKLVPDLAKSYSISEDGLKYSFTLKDNARFQDGSPLTAEDVAFTIQKIQDASLKSPQRANWLNVTVKVTSPTQIQFLLKQPYSPFLSNTTVGILPKHIWGGLNNDQFPLSQYNIEPIGSGPYKRKSIDRDGGGIPVNYKLATWSGYYGKAPHVSTVSFNFFADDEKALQALDSGAIDSLASVDSTEAARLASDTAEPYTVISSPLPRIFGVFFNQAQSAALADKNVRTALDMVIDRNDIVKTALNGYGTPIHSSLPSGLLADLDKSAKVTVNDATFAAAKSLLEKNGWKKNANGTYEFQKKGAKTVTLLAFDIYTANTPDLKQAAEIVKNAWNKLGAQISVKIFEPSDLYQNIISTRKYDALLFGEFIGKDRDLYAFWHSSKRVSPGLNVAMYANSKADKLLEDIRTTSDEKTRISKYVQFDQLIKNDLPAIFLYEPDFVYVVPKSMRNIELGSIVTASDRWNSESSWYNTTEKVWKIFSSQN
jgi:peptide/nickel transport system substrate-binding protein